MSKYGLQLPAKKPAIFNESSDSDEDAKKPTGFGTLKKKERMVQQKILEEDPTVYQYDELYDEMQSQRKESKLARKDLDRKPKYINKLLETAERRKRENERRIERQVQKERETEGDMFKDKESFVTTAYRKKLEELKELEEKEKREEYLENIGDVRKQGDLSGFYRHLYAQQVNFEEEGKKEEDRKRIKENIEVPAETSKTEESEVNKVKNKRKYRRRESTESQPEKAEETEDKVEHLPEHLPSNIDADSDFSIDSSDSESESEKDAKKPKIEKPEAAENVDEKNDSPAAKEENTEKPVEEKPEFKVPKKPKINIWAKRTVGNVFEEALKRYYERKAAREIAI